MHHNSTLLPAWLRAYRRTDLAPDLVAGVTTAVLLVPQAMAYAMLAGLPPIHGLYASMAPLVLYAVSGRSKVLAVGPVALVALLVAAAVGDIAEPDSVTYVERAILLAWMVGLLQVVMSVARLGYLLNFLSQPVVLGFTAAAAILIGVSQVPAFVGWSDVGGSLGAVASAASSGAPVSVPALTTGLLSLAALIAFKRWFRRAPGPLIVIAAASALVAAAGIGGESVSVVGSVPTSLPWPVVQWPDMEAVRALFPAALAIALVGFMESVSVARAFSRPEDGPIRGDRELGALGLANLGAALFQGFPVAGGFSRTAVNAQAGARTQFAALVTAAFVLLSIVAFAPALAHIPRPALAALIMSAVAGLIHVKEMRRLWSVKRADFYLMSLTFLATLALGIEEGILLGAVASLVYVVVLTTRPHYAVLGKLPRRGAWRNVKNFEDAETTPGVLVLRFDAQLYYGNTLFVFDAIDRELARRDEHTRALVLDMAAVNRLDSSAADALLQLARRMRAQNVTLRLAQVKGPVMGVLLNAGVVDVVGPDQLYDDVDSAVCGAARLPDPKPARGVHGGISEETTGS